MLNNDSLTYDDFCHQYAHIINNMQRDKIDTYCKEDKRILALSILYYSIIHNDLPTIQSLQSEGLDIHALRDKGFLLACKHGHINLVQHWIENGADLHVFHSHNWGHEEFNVTGDALGLCVKNNYYDIANYLLQKFDLSENNAYAFIGAVKEGKWDFVYKFIEHGADIHNFSILYHAVVKEHMHFVQYLIEQGVDITQEENSALRLSVGLNNLEMVKLFLNHGANINAVPSSYVYEPDNIGENNSPLATAAANGNWEIFQYLVAYGADLHLEDEDTLRLAACGGNLQIIKFLVDSGADIHANSEWILKNEELYFEHNIHVLDYISSFVNEVNPELKTWFIDNYRQEHLDLLEKCVFKHNLNNSLPINDCKIKRAKV